MKIVLGGSRHIHAIPEELTNLLQEWLDQGANFLVGDAPGADSAFQLILKKLKALNVTIYSSAGYVRNNFGQWPHRNVESGLKSKSHAVHAFKDRVMTSEADLGLMLWDCQSAGTLSNVIDMVESGKSCKVWVSLDSDLYSFDNEISLGKWLAQYPEITTEAFKRLRQFRRRETRRQRDAQDKLFE